MSTFGVSCAFVLGALLGPSRAVSGVVPFWCSHPYAAMAEDENVSSLAAFALPQFGNLDTPSLKGDFSRLSEQHLLLFVPSVIQLRADTFLSGPLFTSGSWLGSSLYGFLESEMDGTGSILDSNHGYGKRASLKDQSLLLGVMMKVLTSPQVGIAAMRQLGSRIILYTSVAAQALQVSAAALEGALPMSIVFSKRLWGLGLSSSRGFCCRSLCGDRSHAAAWKLQHCDTVSLVLEDFVAGLLVGIEAIRQLGSCNTVDSSAASQAMEIGVAALGRFPPIAFRFQQRFLLGVPLGLRRPF